MRQVRQMMSKGVSKFQSTHPMRDATFKATIASYLAGEISIHASHAGCDFRRTNSLSYCWNFNPRIPCGMRLCPSLEFTVIDFISIHASHAGCDFAVATTGGINAISIHASHAGCDFKANIASYLATISIHASHAGCDLGVVTWISFDTISIHASHAGCDASS